MLLPTWNADQLAGFDTMDKWSSSTEKGTDHQKRVCFMHPYSKWDMIGFNQQVLIYIKGYAVLGLMLVKV